MLCVNLFFYSVSFYGVEEGCMRGVKRIVVTGGAGQIAYSLLFRLAAGELFGPDQPIVLQILEVPEALPFLQGVLMELHDCAFPLLQDIQIGSDPDKIFEEADCVFLVGAKPRGPGMERKDLLQENAKIFVRQGRALDQVASKEVVVLVVGNPCNTNCLIARSFAQRINPKSFFAMTRLDENRARGFLARKAGVSVTQVTNVGIWGNHSSTQVPDYWHAKIGGNPVCQVLAKERDWLQEEFFSLVQQRGAEVITARGKSSAASAASAAIDAMQSLLVPSKIGSWVSMGCSSEGNSYGIDPNLIFSFPCIVKGKGELEIVSGLSLDLLLEEKIKITEKELQEERDLIAFLLSKKE